MDGRILLNVHYYEQGNVSGLIDFPSSQSDAVPRTGSTGNEARHLSRPSADHLSGLRRIFRVEGACPDRVRGRKIPGVAGRHLPGDGREDVQGVEEGVADDEVEVGLG